MKENFLSILVIFVFCCQSPPLLSYNCFYAPRSIVWNRYLRDSTVNREYFVSKSDKISRFGQTTIYRIIVNIAHVFSCV